MTSGSVLHILLTVITKYIKLHLQAKRFPSPAWAYFTWASCTRRERHNCPLFFTTVFLCLSPQLAGQESWPSRKPESQATGKLFDHWSYLSGFALVLFGCADCLLGISLGTLSKGLQKLLPLLPLWPVLIYPLRRIIDSLHGHCDFPFSPKFFAVLL